MSSSTRENVSLDSALANVKELFASQYLVVSSVVILLYDTILSFEAERSVIWNSRMSVPKAAYIAYRYAMVFSTLVSVNSSIAPQNPSKEWCGGVLLVISIIIFLADAIGHGLIIFRTFMLWERKPNILRLLSAGSLIVNTTTCVFLGLTVRRFPETGEFIALLHICLVEVKPTFLLGVWAPQAVFDIYVLTLILWNAMDRPRLPNQSLLKAFNEDGLFLIMATWVLRVFNIVLCAIDGAVPPFVGVSITESLIATINLRLLLRIFQSEYQTRDIDQGAQVELTLFNKARGRTKQNALRMEKLLDSDDISI